MNISQLKNKSDIKTDDYMTPMKFVKIPKSFENIQKIKTVNLKKIYNRNINNISLQNTDQTILKKINNTNRHTDKHFYKVKHKNIASTSSIKSYMQDYKPRYMSALIKKKNINNSILRVNSAGNNTTSTLCSKYTNSFYPKKEKAIIKNNSCRNISQVTQITSEIQKENNSYHYLLQKKPPEKIDYNIEKQKKIINHVLRNKIKYPLKLRNDYNLYQKSEQIDEYLKQYNTKALKILKNQNYSLFYSSTFCLVNKGKFSKKFENPIYTSQKIIKNKNLINKNILCGRKMLKEINNRLKLIESTKRDKQILYEKFKNKMEQILVIFYNMKTSLSDIIKYYHLKKSMYNFPNIQDLIFYLRVKDFELSNSLLDNNNCLALDNDQFYRTPLHFAAKYNFFQIIPKLIEYGAYVDSKNFLGETPLIISAQRNYTESIVLFLFYLASPFEKDKEGKTVKECIKDFNSRIPLNKILEIYEKYSHLKGKKKFEKIQKKFSEFISIEYGNYISIECYSFIQTKYNYFQVNSLNDS